MSATPSNPQSTYFSQNIPLETVWALDMPGTQPMNRIQRGTPLAYENPEGQLVDEIRTALKYDPQRRPTAGPCFAVQGTGMTALRQAHAVLVREEKLPTEFQAGEELTLVFYSYQFGAYVHLAEVVNRDGHIDISYRFVPHRTEEVTTHLALIPINSSQPGPRTVHVAPVTNGGDNEAWGGKIVCGSGRFVIYDQ